MHAVTGLCELMRLIFIQQNYDFGIFIVHQFIFISSNYDWYVDIYRHTFKVVFLHKTVESLGMVCEKESFYKREGLTDSVYVLFTTGAIHRKIKFSSNLNKILENLLDMPMCDFFL